MKLRNESETLFIPLYGKAQMSSKNLIIKDPKAEEIIKNIDYDFSKLKQSKYLSMYMALRAKIIDDICSEYINNHRNPTIIHLGSGLDSRVLRVNQNYFSWYDIDYKNVIELRKEYYQENEKYKMIGKSILDLSWLNQIKEDKVLIILEGVTMYLNEDKIKTLLNAIHSKFKRATIIFDAYSKKAVKLSKIKNPVNKMEAKVSFGINNYQDIIKINNNYRFISSYSIKDHSIKNFIFNHFYSGKLADSLYKIYKFKI